MTHNEKKKSARGRALAFLVRRDRTEYQVRLLLTKEGYAPAEIEDAVAFLESLGYVDDAVYAERYLRELIEKGRGRRRIVDEMRRRGLHVDLIAEVLRTSFSAELELENAIKLARKVVGALPEDAEKTIRARKIFLKLTGQGYNFDVINMAMNRVT
ncbi:MAG: RecX family transcriptional regulator [Clostridiales Family XIII bacterium]|jgi:regulatory protein|nr:RecX family transcriptional regulator [Clostridiales Family XIII bacterium]